MTWVLAISATAAAAAIAVTIWLSRRPTPGPFPSCTRCQLRFTQHRLRSPGRPLLCVDCARADQETAR